MKNLSPKQVIKIIADTLYADICSLIDDGCCIDEDKYGRTSLRGLHIEKGIGDEQCLTLDINGIPYDDDFAFDLSIYSGDRTEQNGSKGCRTECVRISDAVKDLLYSKIDDEFSRKVEDMERENYYYETDYQQHGCFL